MTRRSKQFIAILLACLLVKGAVAADAADTRVLQIGTHRIHVEIAATAQSRALGLMYRDGLAPDQGMLFVFDRPAHHCMFMRNTRIPLSAAFLDADGRILAIARMQPFSERLHCAPRPVTHVLEMEQGWFAERGIGPGDRVEPIGGGLAGPAG